MNFFSSLCVFIGTVAGISMSKYAHSTTDLHIVWPEVFRYWKGALGESVGPEYGISDLKNVPNPLAGRLAERNFVRQAMGTAGQKYKIVHWVHGLISTANKNQSCYRDSVSIENREKEAMLIRYQYPIQEKRELRELEQWANKSLHKRVKSYGSDTGFLVVEYLYEMEKEKWAQKDFRISADWEGLTDQIRSMHRSGKRLGGKKIRRVKPS